MPELLFFLIRVTPLPKSIYDKRAIPHTGRDERLLVLGTQTRAPPVCLVPFIWFKYFPAVVLSMRKSYTFLRLMY